MNATQQAGPSRPKGPGGRPRSGASPTGLGTREDILAASAELFCSRGFGGTSTHAIAQTAGIRQASLYHHFSSKSEILLELLVGTVSPSLEAASLLAPRHHEFGAESRLWALCFSDVSLLLSGPVNVGSLYLLPELQDGNFDTFHRLRAELEGCYRNLVENIDSVIQPPSEAAAIVSGLVESVILRRRRESTLPADCARTTSSAALRALGLNESEVTRAQVEGTKALEILELSHSPIP